MSTDGTELTFLHTGNNNLFGGIPNFLNKLSDLRHLNIGTKMFRNDYEYKLENSYDHIHF